MDTNEVLVVEEDNSQKEKKETKVPKNSIASTYHNGSSADHFFPFVKGRNPGLSS